MFLPKVHESIIQPVFVHFLEETKVPVRVHTIATFKQLGVRKARVLFKSSPLFNTESPRQAGPQARVSGKDSQVQPAKRRWVPPSTLRHHNATTPEARNDLVFRKVRGILNKLTPEKFQKLSDDLLRVDLQSSTILKGVIYLIFEKALEEPKYSSMYAQLCKRLDQEAPNYEPPNEPSTFRLLLLNKCRLEFDNRNAALERYVDCNEEDEDRRQVAKGKILGNIKFMGELGKLDILPEGILHRCIRELLAKRSEDPSEDLECMCQIMRTCGRILDSKLARHLMDQYFERMQKLVENADLQPRIRFMLKDIIDLRNDGWVPRKATVVEGPVPINEIRPVEEDNLPFRRPSALDRSNDMDRNNHAGELFRHPLKTRTGIDDMMRGFSLSAAPTANLVPAFGPNGFGTRQQRGGQFGQFSNQRNQYKHNQNNNRDNSNKDLAPRFKKNLIVHREDADSIDLRPNTNLINKMSQVKTNNLMNMRSSAQVESNYSPTIKPVLAPLLKEPLPIKQASQERTKQSKKDKGPSKDEIVNKFGTILDDFWKGDLDLKQCITSYKEQKVPDKFAKDIVLHAYCQALDKTDVEQEKVVKLIGSIKENGSLNSNATTEALRLFCHKLQERGSDNALNAASVILGSAVIEQLASLADLASLTENGNLYPLFLLVLQHIYRRRGRNDLTDMFGRSKVNLLSQLPENERSKERLSEVLEEKDLAFLYPLLRIQAELTRQLQAEPNPQAFYRWIRDHLDPASLAEPGFITALVTALIKHVAAEAAANGDTADNTNQDEKAVSDRECSLLAKYQHILQAFLREKLSLQLAALYSLQAHFCQLGFPKGHLLRWFVAFYDLEIVDEEAYLNWREDVTDAYPGKGQALFQVNQWLNWLQTAESEEEEGDD